jgi:hypothetical protein
LLLLWGWMTYLYHTRHVLRLWAAERARKAARRAAKVKKPETRLNAVESDSDEETDLPHEQPSLIPVVSWMCLWSLAYVACWLFVKAVPLLIGSVYPSCVGCVIVYILMIPG